MKSVTAGERLFLLIRDEILDQIGSKDVRWSNLGTLFDDLGGGPWYLAYVRGASAIHAMRRLLRFWSEERKVVVNESTHVKAVFAFITNNVFSSLTLSAATKLARSVIAAERKSNGDIGPSTKVAVLQGRQRVHCYLCAKPLNVNATSDAADFLTLEHLWPASMGGDSIEENILPACRGCQHHTQDALSWEWLNVHNIVLPVEPSNSALDSVGRRTWSARHFLTALRLADAERLSLKEAFLQLGPIATPIGYVKTGSPVTFFDLKTA
jgi:hypothetical protein